MEKSPIIYMKLNFPAVKYATFLLQIEECMLELVILNCLLDHQKTMKTRSEIERRSIVDFVYWIIDGPFPQGNFSFSILNELLTVLSVELLENKSDIHGLYEYNFRHIYQTFSYTVP